MIELSDLNEEQLRYLKQKWSAEIREIELDKIRAQDRLNARLERRANNAAEIESIKEKLDNAQALLDHLNSTNAPAELITAQEDALAQYQEDYETESSSSGLTDEEAILQQVAIDELELRKTYREGKISEVETLLDNL